MSTIKCETELFEIGSWTILKLPQAASAKLPSRGQTMIKGTMNSAPFQAVLEPDGNGSHWFRVDAAMQKAMKVATGDTVKLDVEPAKDWPEPIVPADLKAALAVHPSVQALWLDITPMARWDWLRWIVSTRQEKTRARRIEVAFSKLKAGKRRPCCFNRNVCTVQEVSKNGVLLEPTQR